MSRYVMLIDSAKCVNCKACVVACQQRNQVPYGHSRTWTKEAKNDGVPAGASYQPGACMHCDKPLCVDACPTGATWKTADGAVLVDPERCIGCASCIKACPYDARFRHPVTGAADKCDYCRGHAQPGREPACVHVCPSRCRVFGDADNPADPVAALLKNHQSVHVVAADCDTRPTDRLRKAETPAPVSAIPLIAPGARWMGSLALFGVVGAFIKRLLPSDREHGPRDHPDSGSDNHNGD